jgi:hypothetical protein
LHWQKRHQDQDVKVKVQSQNRSSWTIADVANNDIEMLGTGIKPKYLENFIVRLSGDRDNHLKVPVSEPDATFGDEEGAVGRKVRVLEWGGAARGLLSCNSSGTYD